jgi:hypothetical protein
MAAWISWWLSGCDKWIGVADLQLRFAEYKPGARRGYVSYKHFLKNYFD